MRQTKLTQRMESKMLMENNLVNYETKTSTSHNYSPGDSSSSPESFPALMEYGVLINYKQLTYLTDIIKEYQSPTIKEG
jgi:hypothetical protein